MPKQFADWQDIKPAILKLLSSISGYKQWLRKQVLIPSGPFVEMNSLKDL